jgi:23S rRNA pseudouridine2605 synthase
VASRRAAEKLIREGAVTVNGQVVTELGSKADPVKDQISVHGNPVAQSAGHVYFALHKPVGYVTTASDEFGRATALDLVKDVGVRVFPVGRLDRDSEGLLLLTNDGDLAARLAHPRYGVEKEYHAQVRPVPSPSALAALRKGVALDERLTAPATVEILAAEGGDAWVRVVIHEGRRRQVRRMCEAVGLAVSRLIRARVGPVELGDLGAGRHRSLRRAEVQALRRGVGLN